MQGNRVFYLLLVAMLILWNCEDKKPLDLVGFDPPANSTGAKLNRGLLVANGSYQPGYSTGAIRSTEITISWQQASTSNFAAYQLYRDQEVVSTTANVAQTSYTDTSGIQPNTFYNYRLVTLDRNGLFSEDTIRIRTPIFETPYNLSSQNLTTTNEAIRLNWQNRAESASRYRIYRKISTAPSATFSAIGTSADTSFVDDNGLSANQTYDYQVTALNDFEETNRSGTLTVLNSYRLIAPDLTILSQVPGLRSVRLSWTDNSNANDQYRIYRQRGNESAEVIATVPNTSNEFVDEDTLASLAADSSYGYMVGAYNSFSDHEARNLSPDFITIRPPAPFTNIVEDFESEPTRRWRFFSSTVDGRITRRDTLAHGGQYMLLMDVARDGVYNINEAILTVDLSSIPANADLFLRFYSNTFDDEVTNVEDFVQVSSDGDSWTTIMAFQAAPFLWVRNEFNLREVAGQQPYSATYKIKWQQADNFSFPTDGIGIDDIEISSQ